jgi:WD40 repeat protein
LRLLIVTVVTQAVCHAADAINIDVPVRTSPVDFETEIAPFLKANCVACHHARKASGGLVLESPQSMIKGGESGPAVVAGNSVGSLLLLVAAHQQESVMPPPDNTVGARPLTPGQLGLLKLWIDQGAAGTISNQRDVRWQTLPAGYQPALAAAVTADGQYAACSRGNRLFVYHVPTGRLITMLEDPEQHDATNPSTAKLAHQDLVRCLAFDPSGDLLASGAFREVKLWRRPRLVRMAEQVHPANIQTIAVSSTGTLATADDNGRIQLRDIESGKELLSFAAHQAEISSLQFSPDASTLYSACVDKSVRVWSVADGKPIGTGIETPAPVHAMALVNQGEWLITGGSDGMARAWEAKSVRDATNPTDAVKPLHEIKVHEGAITALIAIPGHSYQFLTGGADGRVGRWDAMTGKSIAEFRHDAPVIAVAISADARRVASASSHIVILWSGDGKQVAQLKDDPQLTAKIARMDTRITFSKSAISLAQQDLKNYEGLIRIAKVRMEDVKKAEDELVEVQKTRDEKQAALEKVKSENGKVEPAEKALADAETAVTVAGTVIVRAKAIAERTAKELVDAEQAVAAREEQLKQQETARATEAATAKTQPLAIRSISFCANGQSLAVGGESGSIHLFDAEAGHWSQTVPDHQGAIRAIVSTDDGKLITGSVDRRVLVWNAPSRWRLERVIGGLKEPGALVDRVLSVDFSRDGQRLATGGGVPSRSSELKIWNVASGELMREFRDAHSETVFAVRFSPVNNQLASAAGDRFIKIFDTDSGETVRTLAGHAGQVLSLSWQSDGKALVSGGSDNLLKLWDTATGVPVRTMKGTTYRIGPYKREITSVTFIGDSEQILAASGDGTVRLHRTPSENDILTFASVKGYQHAVAATPDGQTVIATGSDGIVRIWSGHEREPKRVLVPEPQPKPARDQ